MNINDQRELILPGRNLKFYYVPAEERPEMMMSPGFRQAEPSIICVLASELWDLSEAHRKELGK